jgi:hypothetical protein
MPESVSDRREGETKVPAKGGKLQKYKWQIVAGLAGIAVIVFYFVRKSSANAAATATPATTSTGMAGSGVVTDPNTGMPVGFGGAQGIPGMAGTPGVAGPKGATGAKGAAGKPGPRGKPGPKPPKPRGRPSPPRRDRVPPKRKHPAVHAANAMTSVNGHNNRILPTAVR